MYAMYGFMLLTVNADAPISSFVVAWRLPTIAWLAGCSYMTTLKIVLEVHFPITHILEDGTKLNWLRVPFWVRD